MVRWKFNKPNFVDVAVAIAVILIVATGAIYYLHKVPIVSTRLLVTVEITEPSQVPVLSELVNVGESVYLNSNNSPLIVAKVVKNIEKMDITLIGPGYEDPAGYYIFNGQRILVNQKAEIHAKYFAQGRVVAIENAK